MRVDEFDLAALAREVAAELTAADTAGRHVEFRCAPVAPVRGDRALLRIVLDNLLGNAWKYTLRQPAPHVEFSIEEKPSEPTPIFTVADNGAGFDMRYAGKLFTPFQRLHTRNEFEGTGIGLATVHRIVTRHGGRVWAESAPGEGTRIHFTLKTSAL
jgi:light-regulated signal transduction histidine kinase (bacteriophytochrome)